MKIGIYFCNCGSNIADKINSDEVAKAIKHFSDESYFNTVDFICSETGKLQFEEGLKSESPDRVIVAACSPRDHEDIFRHCLTNVGLNPYLLQMVNIREQIAWVTDDKKAATDKAVLGIKSAINRVHLHEPLEKQILEISPDVLVIGAGPAGMKAAISLAEAGRKVVIVERSPFIGGLPALFEDVFPAMECAPCLFEPMMAEILHGEYAKNIELLTMAELSKVTGYYGNFITTIHQKPRHVDLNKCIGCGECIDACPVSMGNKLNNNASIRKAIDFSFTGVLPNIPNLIEHSCLHSKGEECCACKKACPVGDNVVNLDEVESFIKRTVGAIIIATGATIYDISNIANMKADVLADIYDSLQFERMLSSTGPTYGKIVKQDGSSPASIAIIHCAGSLDEEHKPYCSGICCQYALKFNHLISSKLPNTKIIHYYREMVLPGKGAQTLLRHAVNNKNSSISRYDKISDFLVAKSSGGQLQITIKDESILVDMLILCPPIIPSKGSAKLASILGISLDSLGFFKELHGRLDAVQSSINGIYLAGTCHEPMDIVRSTIEGMATAGYILAGLQPGRTLEIEPITADIDETKCARCHLCISLCPYSAIYFNSDKNSAIVNPLLCHGCGICVVACPAGAIIGHGFTDAQIMAEIEGALK